MISPFSQSWYRVATIKPKVRSHIQWVRHDYRGETWYLLRDMTSGKLHRFNSSTKSIIEKMNGRHSMADIWHTACAELGDDMPSQDELIQLLTQLYRANCVQSEVIPDLKELEQRRQQEQRSQWWSKLKSPLSLRIPLWNPDQFLNRTQWLGAALFHPLSGLLFLLLLIVAALQLGVHWQAITVNVQDQAFSAGNWLAIACIYPLLKLLHELGHGYAVKRWGGGVHDMGVMLLVFIPVPYVDASAASLFPNKYQRLVVSLAGIFVELGLAAIALLLWVQVEPGLFRAALFNIMLIGGVSTVLFNGNPLLRFDAYYALADWLEMPNFGQRANRYFGYLLRRYLLRLPEIILRDQQASSEHAKNWRESAWLCGYSLLSFVYRITVMIGIALFVASKMFFIGVILAVWVLIQSLLLPLIKTVRWSMQDAQSHRYQGRLFGTAGAVALSVFVLVAVIPLPNYTVVQGVYWAPQQSQLRAGADCFIDTVVKQQNEFVNVGDVILTCNNPQLQRDAEVVAAQLQELNVRRRAILVQEPMESAILRDEMARTEEELKFMRQRLNAMTIVSEQNGTLKLERPQDLIGRFVRRGSYLGYVDNDEVKQIRVAIPQSAIAQVRENLSRDHLTEKDRDTVTMRKSSRLQHIAPATIIREIPQADNQVPDLALTTAGGGDIVVDQTSASANSIENLTALENWFQFDLEVTEPGLVGERVYVRFRHSPEPLVKALYRNVRRLFLNRFAV